VKTPAVAPAEPGAIERLDERQIAGVLEVMRAADVADGTHPLSEEALLHLREAGVHLLAESGYGHFDTATATVELVVHPMHRHRGVGRALAEAALAAADELTGGELHAWAHGDHPSATALALDLGLERVRELWQLRRPLATPLPEAALPAGVTLRAFRPGDDDERWLALNAAAFADHPEQGRWTVDDLRLRLREPWFDAAGFLLAVDAAGDLVGFHWTKRHSESLGEVYVLGVAPGVASRGLGAALTLAGLRHLRKQGVTQAMLYVDGSNRRAAALYLRLGFMRWSTDVSFTRRPKSVMAPSDGN
jgi:mycothiol synthase